LNPKWNFAGPHHEGQYTRQAHVNLPDHSFERELGREGFFGAASHMYHRNPPTAWSAVTGAIRPRAFAPLADESAHASPWDAPVLLANRSVRIRTVRLGASMDHLVRNADGDDLLFVHDGAGDFYCDYGHLSVAKGDYVVVPRGVMWRLDIQQPTTLLMIESTGDPYALPDRGTLGRHAPFDPGVFERPTLDEAFLAQPRGGEWLVRVKRGEAIGTITYPFNPLDAIGWKGDLFPVRLSIKDIRAVTSDRLHLPPSVRTTFISRRFVVCTLIPRVLETDPRALKLPFFHNNDDYDEVIFQHEGKLSSRSPSVRPGVLTFHPGGITHGPHPEMLPFLFDVPSGKTESYSVMIDTRDPLEVMPAAAPCEVAGYAESWKGSIAFAPDASQAEVQP
jgi:homogentisate 1,2-dioxygenase